MTLTDIFPDVDALLSLSAEDVVPVVLRLAEDGLQNGKIHPEAIFQQVRGPLSQSKATGRTTPCR